MSGTIKCSFSYKGKLVSVELTDFTNEEHNAYYSKCLEFTENEPLFAYRAAEFDKRCVSCSVPKETISSAVKSSVMAQLFNSFAVDVKN